MKFISTIQKLLVGDVSPMVYTLLFMSAFIGFIFATAFIFGKPESILYQTHLLIRRPFWGTTLFVNAVACTICVIKKWTSAAEIFDIICFMLWLFASISLVLAGHGYVFVTVGLMHTLFHLYLYLAVATGTLYRVPESSITPL